MARSLAKVTKKISKKKGNINSLHENSRDSQKLRRAYARAEKLNRVSVARAKANEPYLERIAYFQEVAKTITATVAPGGDDAIEISQLQSFIQRYLNRHNDELAQLQHDRRPGRPASAREELLKQHMTHEEREYEAGFWLPDMQDGETLRMLCEWNGEWTALARLKYVRLTRGGVCNRSRFPPKGES